MRGEGSAKRLPNIKFTTPSASKGTALFSQNQLSIGGKEAKESFRTVVDKAIDQHKLDQIYENQTYSSSFRNYYVAVRSQQNNTALEGGYLPKLNLKVQGHHHYHSVL
jgi:hypothetical protein